MCNPSGQHTSNLLYAMQVSLPTVIEKCGRWRPDGRGLTLSVQYYEMSYETRYLIMETMAVLFR